MNKLELGKIVILTFIHNTAYISPEAVAEHGTVVLLKSIINTGVIVKRGYIINFATIIDHRCVIENGVHVYLEDIVKAEN